MNKKIESEIAIGILILVAILVGGAFWMRSEKAQAPLTQSVAVAPEAPTAQLTTQQAAIQPTLTDATANWQTYTNSKYNFALNLPQGFTWKENDQSSSGLYNVYFSNQQANTEIDLAINSNDWVAKIKDPNAELRDYYNNLYSGDPHVVSTKVINWTEGETKANQTVYYYTVETNVDNGPKFQTIGAVLLSNGELFDFSSITNDQQLLEEIVTSFDFQK